MCNHMLFQSLEAAKLNGKHCQTSNIIHTLIGNKIFDKIFNYSLDYSDVVLIKFLIKFLMTQM